MLPTIYIHYRPGPPLNQYVDQLWYWEGAQPLHNKDRLMPDGSCSVVINLAEDQIRNYSGEGDDVVERFDGAIFMGAHSRYSVIDSREQTAVIGITFRPGGAWPFFDPAADELQNLHVNLADLWGTHGRSLRERVLAERTPTQRLALVERELTCRAVRPFMRRPEVEFALQRLTVPNDAVSIERLSEHCGLSARRLSRLFAIEVGLTPKLYARIKRFERMFGRLGGLELDWSEVAIDCGYFDQPHLIRDCKMISGFTPTQLQSRWSGNGHHVPLL
jgi:AraC-like DNA-binding protein